MVIGVIILPYFLAVVVMLWCTWLQVLVVLFGIMLCTKLCMLLSGASVSGVKSKR